MIISSPITAVIQSDSGPTVARQHDIAFLSNAAVRNCGLSDSLIPRRSEFFETMADSSDSKEIEITDLVEQFMAVTGAEDTVALSYLQQSTWNVEVCSVFLLKFELPFLNHLICSIS